MHVPVESGAYPTTQAIQKVLLLQDKQFEPQERATATPD